MAEDRRYVGLLRLGEQSWRSTIFVAGKFWTPTPDTCIMDRLLKGVALIEGRSQHDERRACKAAGTYDGQLG